jgi:hypothetical protein
MRRAAWLAAATGAVASSAAGAGAAAATEAADKALAANNESAPMVQAKAADALKDAGQKLDEAIRAYLSD